MQDETLNLIQSGLSQASTPTEIAKLINDLSKQENIDKLLAGIASTADAGTQLFGKTIPGLGLGVSYYSLRVDAREAAKQYLGLNNRGQTTLFLAAQKANTQMNINRGLSPIV